MPATIYYDDDADLGLLEGKQGRGPRLRLAGSRARAEPEGLRRRRASSACARARRRGPRPRRPGCAVLTTAEACKEADVIMVLLPDTEQKRVYEADIEPNLDERRLARVRARVQHPLRPDPAARRASTCG